MNKYFAKPERNFIVLRSQVPEVIKNVSHNNKMSQFYGDRHTQPSATLVRVPARVRKAAARAIDLRDVHGFIGATETGWKRAHQLSTQSHIPIEDLRYMRNWYARHFFTSKPGYDKWIAVGSPTNETSKKKSRPVLSWLTWGGDAGLQWVNSKRVISLLNKNFDKKYKIIN